MRLADDLERDAVRYQGNWIPHKLRPATEDGIFFVGDSAGQCLPLTAEGIRTALLLRDRLRAASCGGVVAGEHDREAALRSYAEFSTRHERKFRWMLRVQSSCRGSRRACCAADQGDGPRALRRLVIRPLPANRPAGVRGPGSAEQWRARGRAGRGVVRSADDQVGARQQQGDPCNPAGAQGRLLEAEEADPVEDHGGGQLSRDRGRSDSTGADRLTRISAEKT